MAKHAPKTAHSKPAKAEPKTGKKPAGHDSWRETVESVVIAFALAFLFRGFEAEGFEIPTGSMATTLMGLHKDLACPQCGYQYQAGASEIEMDPRTNTPTGLVVRSCICPMCRFTANVAEGNPQGKRYFSYSGDRIQAAKFTYYYDEPQRWDVTLFKFPHGAETNYIKRLVGLPNETVRIWHGDIYTKGPGQSEFKIERKPAEKVRAMLQEVYDNDYLLESIHEKGWPLRWRTAPPGESGWQLRDQGRSFALEAPTDDIKWLVYEHTPPYWADWQKLQAGPLPANWPTAPQLVTDFKAYNTASQFVEGPLTWPPQTNGATVLSLGMHWVGDLEVEAEVEVTSATGEMTFELVEAGRHYTATFDVASGLVVLADSGQELARAATPLVGPDTYTVSFANVDDQLLLWIDGSVVEFAGAVGGGVPYASVQAMRPQPADLQPVKIGGRKSTLVVRHLNVRRDVYYIAPQVANLMFDYALNNPLIQGLSEKHLKRMMSDPAAWSFFDGRGDNVFEIGADRFLMLGDNSGGSSDSRIWQLDQGPAAALVSRDLLIGKAMFVYWPHPWYPSWSIPVGIRGFQLRIPLYPNFSRFRFVR